MRRSRGAGIRRAYHRCSAKVNVRFSSLEFSNKNVRIRTTLFQCDFYRGRRITAVRKHFVNSVDFVSIELALLLLLSVALSIAF